MLLYPWALPPSGGVSETFMAKGSAGRLKGPALRLEQLSGASRGFRSVGTGGIVNVRERDFWKYTQSKELRLLHPQAKIN